MPPLLAMKLQRANFTVSISTYGLYR